MRKNGQGILFAGFFQLVAAAVVVSVGALAAADEKSQRDMPEKWLTGDARVRALTAPVGMVSWEHAPVGNALTQFTRVNGLALLLDRRVNPDMVMNKTGRNASVPMLIREGLNTLEDPFGVVPNAGKAFALSQVGDVLYVGPEKYTRKLRTLVRVQENRVPAKAKKIWKEKSPLAWKHLATPKDILTEIAANAGIKIVNLKVVPHDLWRANALPELTLTEQLTLILGQFAMTYVFEADASVRIVPLKLDEITLRETYAATREPLLETVMKRFPETKVARQGGKIQVEGVAEVHEFLLGDKPGVNLEVGAFPLDATSEKAMTALREVRFSGRLEGGFLELMTKFCKDYQLELSYDLDELATAGIDVYARVWAEPVNRTLEDLLSDLAGLVKCSVEVNGNHVRLFAK